MKKWMLFLSIFLFLLSSYSSFSKIKSPQDLPPKFRKWLEEEVVYIISPKEKEVFLSLETDRERQIFIEAFWRQRDPDPLTPENEFKKEHYRRLNYANQRFGREGPGKGWRTAMGRIYILLGEPAQIWRFENESEIYPTVVWFYQGMGKFGLPDSFYVVFFKRSGIGEYELYSPIRDGPQSLIIHYQGDPADYQSAYSDLYSINPTVANVSLSLIPEEMGRIVSPSLASEILVKDKIPKTAYEKLDVTYAEKLLAYKDIIEVEYTANYVSNNACVKIIKEPRGIYFVHYLIEPKKLNLIQVDDRFRANLVINGRVADPNNKIIYQWDRSVSINFNQDQLNNIKYKLFSFQDVFPLIEGNYKLNVLLKNTMTKEFTSIEQKLSIPGAEGLWISPLILANKIVKNSKYQGYIKPFLIGSTQLVPSPRNDFTRQDHLYLFFQITNIPEELQRQDNLEIECNILQEGKVITSHRRRISGFSDPLNIIEEFSLEELSPDYYQLRVSLLDSKKQKIAFQEEDFLISSFPQIPRPWVLSIPQPPSIDPLYLNILGKQWFQKGQLARARTFLSEAYRHNPSSKEFTLDYSQFLVRNKEYLRAKEIISPHLKGSERIHFLLIYAQSCQALKEYTEAISFYKEYLSHFGANLNVLNALGECYYQLGQMDDALLAWEKSLELNPNQEKIRQLVDFLKKKR